MHQQPAMAPVANVISGSCSEAEKQTIEVMDYVLNIYYI
jgi:hypothetical protein